MIVVWNRQQHFLLTLLSITNQQCPCLRNDMKHSTFLNTLNWYCVERTCFGISSSGWASFGFSSSGSVTRGILVEICAVLHACEWLLTTVFSRVTVEHTTVSPYITKEMKWRKVEATLFNVSHLKNINSMQYSNN